MLFVVVETLDLLGLFRPPPTKRENRGFDRPKSHVIGNVKERRKEKGEENDADEGNIFNIDVSYP